MPEAVAAVTGSEDLVAVQKPAKRLPKELRREQLLDTAMEILRREGAEALTLGHLAERAGVTKPIAYEHFGTRAKLLLVLFHRIDDRTTEAVREALKRGGHSIEEVAAILSRTYVDCCLSGGPEFGALLDALSAAEELGDFRQDWRAFLVEEFRKGFAPHVKLPRKQLEALLLGILGAAEILAQAASARRLPRGAAIATLTRIMTAALKPV